MAPNCAITMVTPRQVAGLAADLSDPGRRRDRHHAPDTLAGIPLARKVSTVTVSSLDLARLDHPVIPGSESAATAHPCPQTTPGQSPRVRAAQNIAGLSRGDFGAKPAGACKRRAGVITSTQPTSAPPSAKRQLLVRVLVGRSPAHVARARSGLPGSHRWLLWDYFSDPGVLSACRSGLEAGQKRIGL
jgi:hypothetical protein